MKTKIRLWRRSWWLSAAVVIFSGVPAAADSTYTLDADFALGTLINVNFDPPNSDQLQINTTTSTFPVLWIANAGEDTVSRIDTDDDCEVARYESWFFGNHLGNAFAGPAPSRTAVDSEGNVYVANRHFDGRPPSVMKILLDGGIDRNNNGVIDTSTDDGDCLIDRNDPAELIRLVDNNPANGILDQAELLDERVAWVTQVAGVNDLGRSLCIAPDGNIWLGTFQSGPAYFEIDSTTGAVISGPHPNSNSNYGCVVDTDGTLYGANLSSNMAILDTNNPTSFSNPSHSAFGANYGIALGDPSVYLASSSGLSYVEYNKTTGTFSTPADVFLRTLGISVDGDGDIVLGQSTIYKFDASDGSVIWSTPNPAGLSDQRGVIVDSSNNIWVVNKNSNNVTKFRGSDGAFIATIPVGNQPYTYSDATGLGFISTAGNGFWTVINDSGVDGTSWDSIDWNNEPEASEPPGTSITVQARASDVEAQLPLLGYSNITNGATPTGLIGRYIQIRTTLAPASDGTSPVLSDLRVFAQDTSCDQDGDGDVDRIDVKTVFGLRGQSVPPAPESADLDGDGQVTVLDGRLCVLQCNLPNCEEPVTRGKNTRAAAALEGER